MFTDSVESSDREIERVVVCATLKKGKHSKKSEQTVHLETRERERE